MVNADGSMKPLSETLGILRESFRDLTEAEQAEYASQIFGKEAMSGMLAIINASEEDYNALTDAINNTSGAAEEMVEVKLANLEERITILKSGLEGLALELYSTFSDQAIVAVEMLTEAVGNVTTALREGGIPCAYT